MEDFQRNCDLWVKAEMIKQTFADKNTENISISVTSKILYRLV